jgi:transposase
MTVKGFEPATGELVEIKRLPNEEGSLREYFEKLPGPLYGAMESGTNSWAVYRILEPYFERLIVVDPATVWGRDVRRGAKTDRRDAMKLAVKMYRGELEALYVPDVETQDQRALGRGKVNASRHVTKLVNEIGSLLRSWGVIVDCSLLSKKGQELIEESRARLPRHSLMVLDLWMGMLSLAQAAEAELESAVEEEAGTDEDCQRLMSIPDVGPLTALVVKAEVGDITRFASPAQLVCYSGLSPSVLQSSESIYYGKLNKFCNKFLKYVLVLRAQGMARSKQDNPLRQTYWRVALRHKSNPAKIAVARQLVRVIHSLLKNKQYWDASKITDRRSRAPAGA